MRSQEPGYWPATYMILEAMQALLPLPRLTSQSPSRSLMTVTKKRFSSSSDMAPEMDPTAQQRCSNSPRTTRAVDLQRELVQHDGLRVVVVQVVVPHGLVLHLRGASRSLDIDEPPTSIIPGDESRRW